ncbi:hypothetical protein [Lacrimispora sp.]|uniref:hypothetical protein n=1 Tax=Lacrimispora sp. TaxID=2719234 RepID=UPI0028AF527B|nr:hypothetical protein [Lacrimispora sp.]
MAKGYVVIMLSIFIICTGCSRTSKEIELQNKVDQLQKQLDELNEVDHGEDDSNETIDIEETNIHVENESATESSVNEIADTIEIDSSNKSRKEIYNDALAKFQSGEFEPAQQMFVQLDDFEDSYVYRQYLKLIFSVQNNDYRFDLGENIGQAILIDGLNMIIDGNQYSLRPTKKFGYYYLTTAALNSNGEELCISGDKGQIDLTKMQFRNGEISVFRTETDSTYVTEEREVNNRERKQMIDELQEKAKASRKYNETVTITETKTDPLIGMTSEEVIASTWGKPIKINKTTYAWGVTEQWCYKDNRYIYLENGSVVAIQE